MRANIPSLSSIEALENIRRLHSAPGPIMPGMKPQDLTVGGTVRIDERTVPGPEGQPNISILILHPASEVVGLPAIYHIHGGGMVCGNNRSGLDDYATYVSEGRAVVLSVEYRLAPEHPDPAPVEDCYAGLKWTAEHAEELGIDPSRIMIAGGSAGGGLAAGTALMARDRGFPHLTHQVLACPMLDDRVQTHSSQMLVGEQGGPWDRDENIFGWNQLLGERRGGPDVSPYAAPARAKDLSGLPRTYIDCGSAETFRDEDIEYARRLSEAGVNVDFHMWGGGFHGFDAVSNDAAIAQASRATRAEFIRRALEL